MFDAGDRVYAMNANGSHRSLLFSGSRGSGPDTPLWSPDGTHILFYDRPIVRPNATRSSGRIAEVRVMNANGTRLRRLYHSNCCVGGIFTAVWSPDGRYIAFALGGIYLMDAHGRHLHRLIGNFAVDPAWQSVP